MKDATEILLTYASYHEWVSGEILRTIEKSKLMSEEILSYLHDQLAVHDFWICAIQGVKWERKEFPSSIKELSEHYSLYHEQWKNIISTLNKDDFSRLVKFSNKAGLITTNSLIDLILESFRLIGQHQYSIATLLENNYRKRLRLGFLDYRQRRISSF